MKAAMQTLGGTEPPTIFALKGKRETGFFLSPTLVIQGVRLSLVGWQHQQGVHLSLVGQQHQQQSILPTIKHG